LQLGIQKLDGVPHGFNRAEQEVYPRWAYPKCANRVISGWWLPWVLRLPVSANQWTFISLLLGLAAVAALASGDYPTRLAGVLLFQLFYLADNWDGEVARARGTSTQAGAWLDIAVDWVVQTLLPAALAVGLWRNGSPEWVLLLGAVAGVGICLDFLVTVWGKLRGFGPAVCGDPSRGGVRVPGLEALPWVRANLTNENLSLLVGLVVVLDWRLPFLAVSAVGSHLFWIGFLGRQWRRLLPA